MHTTKVAISAASSGDNTLLAAITGKAIRVHSLFFIASSAVNIRFESAAGGTALTGVMEFAANGGMVLPFNPDGWFETVAGELLNLELSGAVGVRGAFAYSKVPV